ncbi:hypothetical protein AN280_22140 [Pseudomonas aeruginosa]|nr:hypothetical protein ATC05_24040 [Pseudomonas aeruginosa]KQJ53199.1 hypothetical protein AN280_22140 [Pseudomonas aeruginosa]KXE41432.1 hypothetical protein AW924_09440 [Pseudomonas aeruginosa]KXE49304.1 hypothetical protein AW925_09575 [Pseudomonas aeruginosa]KXE51317.1 hypothetical protein AW926_09240 [Pseudomonas aeruginosa]
MQIAEAISTIGFKQPCAKHGPYGIAPREAGNIGKLQLAFSGVRCGRPDDGFAASKDQASKRSACGVKPCLPRELTVGLGITMLDPQNLNCSLEELATCLR